MRNIVIVAPAGGGLLEADSRILLRPARQAVKQVMSVGKHVSGVMENREADNVLKKRQRRRRHAQFDVVHDQYRAPKGKTRYRIARSSLVQSESAMRVSASSEETLGQRQAHLRIRALPSRLRHDRIPKRSFNPDPGGAGQDEFLI